MKKLIIILVTCLLAAGILCGCGKKSSPTPPTPPVPTPPYVQSITPGSGTTGVARNSMIFIAFSWTMNQSSVQQATTVAGMTGRMRWRYNILIFTPDSAFGARETVKVSVSTTAQDDQGVAMDKAYSAWFVCGDSVDLTPPTVLSRYPADTANVSTEVSPQANFSEVLAPWAEEAFTLSRSDGSSVSGNAVKMNDSTIVYHPASPLDFNALHTALVDTTLTDWCGNKLAARYTWSFRTCRDTVPPAVTGTTPGNGETGVSVNQTITVQFSKPMDTASVRQAFSASPAISGLFTWSDELNLAIAQQGIMSFHTTYQVMVGIGARSKSGLNLASPYSLSFSTARGIYTACNGAGAVFLHQQTDLQAGGSLSSYPAVNQVRMKPDGSMAYVLAANGVHYLQVHNRNNHIGSTGLPASCYGLAVSPDGSLLAVTDTTNNRVTVINTATMQAAGSATTPVACPRGVIFSSNGSRLYVLCGYSNTMLVYTTANLSTNPVLIPNIPNGGEELALSAGGDRVYAACGLGVTAVRTADNYIDYEIPSVSQHPWGLALSPDGAHLAVSCNTEGLVKVFAAAGGTVPLFSIPVGSQPRGLAYSPDGQYLYVAVYGANAVKVLSRGGNYAVANTISVGAGPWGIAVTP